MILGPLLLALALNAQDPLPNSKAILANGDTLSGPGKIITNDGGPFRSDENVAVSVSGKTYGAQEIKSARIGGADFLSLRKDGGRFLGRVMHDGTYAKTLSFSPAGFSPGFGGLGGGPGGNTMTWGGGTSFSVDYYTVNMEDAEAINYHNLYRDLGGCRASRTDLFIHKTLIYTSIGGALAAAILGTTAKILWDKDQKSDSQRHDALINGLGGTAGVSGLIAIGCVIGLGSHFDRFLIASIRDFRK